MHASIRICLKMALALICLQSTLSMSQTSPPADKCASVQTRQFDFWIGDWDVFDKDGTLAGTNLIAPMYKGCVLHESWKTPTMEGQSFNRYDASRDVWHQTWVDSNGGILLIEGKFLDGAMTLSDALLAGKKNPQNINEIAWTKLPDGSVRQHWRGSKDAGATWKTVFDGKYIRSKRPQPAPIRAATAPS